MTRFSLSLCALTLLPWLVPSAAAEPAGGDPLAAIRPAIRELARQEMKNHGTEGLSLALVDDRQVLWTEGFGYADKARKLPARPETLYSAGGLTQAFTAALALQLAEQGLIALDRALREQLPEFSMRSRFSGARPITPRHLLSHHAGLPAMHMRDMWARKPEPLAAFLARLKDEYVAFPPAHVYVHSFIGYDVLGRLIETRCGQAYADCVQKRLLAPLGMRQSGFDHSRDNRPLLAQHYWSDKEVDFTDVRDVPAAGLVSNVLELGAFAQMLLAGGRHAGHTLLSPASVADLLRPQNLRVPLDLDNDIGMPWHLTGAHFPQARTVAWLNNESPFARGRILLVPEHRLAVVLMTNSSASSEVVNIVSERLMELVLQQRRPLPADARETAVSSSPPARRKADLTGHYATLLGRITVQAHGNRYRAQMLGKRLELYPQQEGLLAPEYHLLGIVPIPIGILKEARLTAADIAGRHLAVAYYRNHAYRLGERIAPVKLSAAWLKRLGDYRAVEQDALLKLVKLQNVTLAYTDGLLLFRYRVPGWLGLVAEVPVRPVSDTELVVEGTGWLMGETVHVARRDGRDVLRYSGYEFRRIGQP
jgi:CubicO group peptidase (beta-lactamase class C family)